MLKPLNPKHDHTYLFPLLAGGMIATEEHCQGLTAREDEVNPGQAHEGAHNLSTKGEEIGN
jgi:hypothetical protein